MRMFGRLAALIVAIAAIGIGLTVLNISLMGYLPHSDRAVMIINSIIGIAGVFLLIDLIMALIHGDECTPDHKNTHHRTH